MSSLTPKLWYFGVSAVRGLSRQYARCPSCGCPKSARVSSKYAVTSLRRCSDCHLLYRAPIDHQGGLENFYETRYSSGFTTDMPSTLELAQYLENGFANTPKDFRRYLRLLESLGVPKGARVLDLGCSWGYGAWQLAQAGYEVYGVEVGSSRAAYAREKLGIAAFSSLQEVPGKFDVIFSSHVLEHIASLGATLDDCDSRLRAGGLFVAVTPNGSDAFRQRSPRQWNRLWGAVHPLFMDEGFWRRRCERRPFYLSSAISGVDAARSWARGGGQVIGDLSDWELLVVYRNQSL